MKKMLQICLLISICLVALSISSAQIPNAGFETWTAGSPTSWTTDNVLSLFAPITQTSDAHSGSYAMQGATVSYLTINYPPEASADFSISARYSSLKGWYKFSPAGGDSLYAHVIFYKGATPIAAAQFFTGASVSSYTQFTAPITYFSSDVPDAAMIEFLIMSTGAYHIGSTFKMDDLSFGPATGVEESSSIKPNVFTLSQNYPNPFNPSTTISFSVPSRSFVSLKVFDCLGKEVGTIVSEELSAGNYLRQWNASSLPSGIYYYRLQSGSFTDTKKLVLLR